MKLRLGIGLLLFSSVSACTEQGASARERIRDSSDGIVSLASRPYRETTLSAFGAVSGQANPPGETLVWVDDVAAGKRVGGILRRTVTIEDGKFVPSIQDVPVGTTINVFSRDRAGHTAIFMRGEESVAKVRTMDAGQVVPSETIAGRAGLVEARLMNPPGATAYIAAFDHPYHTVTNAAGSFRIDSLPPGTYTIKMWRAGMSAPESQRVTIAAGGAGKVIFGAPPSAPTDANLAPGDTLRPNVRTDSTDSRQKKPRI